MKQINPMGRAALFIFIAMLLSALAPPEKTLGYQARLIYFHGAWVWAALLSFAFSATLGLYGFISGRTNPLHGSIALQRSALIFWFIFIPMSLWVMQVSWNGLFLAEPRFRIPFNFAMVGLIFQVATTLIANPRLSSLVNFVYVAALFVALRNAEYVLHPQMPLLNSQSAILQGIFVALVILLGAACWNLAQWLNRFSSTSPGNPHPSQSQA
jgi:hypothetical protein